MRHKILFTREHNENADSAMDPVRVYDPAADAGLLERTGTFCINWDNNGLVTCNLYAVREVELPDWLSPAEWLRDVTGWRFTFARIGRDDDESLARFAFGLSAARAVAVGRLLGVKKFRSEFRASLAEQLRYWLSASPDVRPPDPFTRRQWECLVSAYDVRDAGRIDNNVYYGARYRTIGVAV